MIKSTSKNKKSCTLRNEKKLNLNKLNLKKEINYNKLKNWREDLH